jgi:hypothetical protein
MGDSIRRQIARTALGIGLASTVALSAVSPAAAATGATPIVVRAEAAKPLTPEEKKAYLESTKSALTTTATKPDGSNAGEVKAAVTVVGACLQAQLDGGADVKTAEATCARILDLMVGPTGTESYTLSDAGVAAVQSGADEAKASAKRLGWSNEDADAAGQLASSCLSSNLRQGMGMDEARSRCLPVLVAAGTIKRQADAAPIPDEPVVSNAIPAPLQENPNLSSNRNADGSITEYSPQDDGRILVRTRFPDGRVEEWHDANAEQSTASSGPTQLETREENLQAAEEEGGNNAGNSKRRTGGDDGKKDEKNNSKNNSGGGNNNHQHSGGCNCGSK